MTSTCRQRQYTECLIDGAQKLLLQIRFESLQEGVANTAAEDFGRF